MGFKCYLHKQPSLCWRDFYFIYLFILWCVLFKSLIISGLLCSSVDVVAGKSTSAAHKNKSRTFLPQYVTFISGCFPWCCFSKGLEDVQKEKDAKIKRYPYKCIVAVPRDIGLLWFLSRKGAVRTECVFPFHCTSFPFLFSM